MTLLDTNPRRAVHLEGAHGRVVVTRPAPTIVTLGLAGRDVADLVGAVADEIALDLQAPVGISLFVDARRTVGVSMMMSRAWARWLASQSARIERVALLTGSGFLRLTGEFVRAFAGLGQKLEFFVDPELFRRVQERSALVGRAAVPC